MVKKENFKKKFDTRIKENLDFINEFKYIYKKNKYFNELSNENQNLYKQTKNKQKINILDYENFYNHASNISFFLESVAEKEGLFRKKIKKPFLVDKSVSGNERYLNFYCGDLFLRKNVILEKDIKETYKVFSKYVDTIQNKLNLFHWQMSYYMPVSKEQINKLTKTQTSKHCIQTSPVLINVINFNLNDDPVLGWGVKDNILYLAKELINTDLKSVIKLSKKLKNLKKIYFVDYEIIKQPEQFNNKNEVSSYISKDCKNSKFSSHSLTLNFDKKTNLDKIKQFSNKIDKKVEIKFLDNNFNKKGENF